MDLKRMRSFVTVAEELHFGRAATRLNIVQPALTQHIKQLERELGVPLLNRTAGKISLTDSGHAFLHQAHLILRQVGHAAQLARDAAQGTAGRLTIGFPDHALWSNLPLIARAFRQKFPQATLDLQQMDSRAQEMALRNGELDIAILPDPPIKDGVDTLTLISAPANIVLPHNHPLGALPTIALETLSTERFIPVAAASEPQRLKNFVALCAQAGFAPILDQPVEQMHTAIALVGAGFGIALAPAWMRAACTEKTQFRPLSPLLPCQLILTTLQGANRALITSFKQTASQIVQDTSA